MVKARRCLSGSAVTIRSIRAPTWFAMASPSGPDGPPPQGPGPRHALGLGPPPLRPEVIAVEVGGDGEEPRSDVGIRGQRSVSLVRSHEGLLGQVVGIARARGRPHEIAVYLGMVRGHDTLEGGLGHVPDHETP